MKHSRAALIGILLAAPSWHSAALAVEPLNDLTGPWQLFVDDYAIEQRTGLERTYHAFQKYPGNPVIRPDRPWEARNIYMYGNVLPNETRTGYRIWYHCLDLVARENRLLYAESTDGINWVKPSLGNVSYNGSTNNNIYFQRNTSDHIASLIHTPWDTPERQYKLMNFNGSLGGFVGAWSANGTDFVSDPANPLVTGTGDVGNFVYDFHRDEYLGYVKLGAYVGGLSRRSVAITSTSDWTSWPTPYIVLKPDEFDDRWATGLRKTDFYGLTAFPYEAMYVGFVWVLRVTSYYSGCQDGPIFVELVTSRDGIEWKRQEGDRSPILPLGPYESWDGGMIFTAQQPLVENGQIKLYYGGIDDEHCRESQWDGGIGLATMRKDGFASLDAGAEGGSLITRRLLNASELHVNYATLPGGSVRVEVLDQDGQVIPGYSLNDCAVLQGDSVDQLVDWGGQANLPAISPLCFRFVLENASLYSFRAAEPVHVMQPPLIVVHPSVQRIGPGETAQFAVAASGEAPFTYQWQRDGVDLNEGGHYSGTDTDVLTVVTASSSDAGQYRCKVTNAGGNSISDSAKLQLGSWQFNAVSLPGQTTSTLNAMSAGGTAVCGASGGQAMVWTALGGTVGLGMPAGASASSAAGLLENPDQTLYVGVNATFSGIQWAWNWQGTVAGQGQFAELKRLVGALPWTISGLGSDGTNLWVVGSSMNTGDLGGREAVIYSSSSDSTSVTTLPNFGHDHSDLHCVSDNGYAVGQYQYGGMPPAGGARNGYLYTPRKGAIALNTLAGSPSTSYEAISRCISRDGIVMGGWSGYPGGGAAGKPVIWKNPVSLTTIAFPPGPSVNSAEVRVLNVDGTIAAGSAWQLSNPTATARAFIWDAVNGTRDLQLFLESEGFDLSGWTLQEVTGMSADGTMMCGNGLYNGNSTGWVFSFVDTAAMAPLVVAHPQSQVVPMGAPTTFEVAAIGDEPLEYRWELDGVEVVDGSSYSGSNTPTLNILAMSPTLAGQYRCCIFNPIGQACSNAAELSLLTVQADFDRDGDVDQSDYGFIQACLKGPFVSQAGTPCEQAMLDDDDDVDPDDLVRFLNCWTGPGVLIDLGCE